MQDRGGALGGLIPNFMFCVAGSGRRLAADPSADGKEIPRTAGVAGGESRP
jgi:hypothetical protein